MALTIKTGVEGLSFCKIGRAGVTSYWLPRPAPGCKYQHGEHCADELMRHLAARQHEVGNGDLLYEIVKEMRYAEHRQTESAFLARLVEYAVSGYTKRQETAAV